MEGLKDLTSRSTYYSDKKDLRLLGLWPPSASPVTLPALALPPLETFLSAEDELCEYLNTNEAA